MSSKYGDSVTFFIQDIEEYDWQKNLSSDKAVVFLVATYGDGEPTDSAADFFGWVNGVADDAANGEGDDSMLKVESLWLLSATTHAGSQ